MSGEQDAERNEAATPYRLEQARKKGNVLKSADAGATAVLLALVVFVYASAWGGVRQVLALQWRVLHFIGQRGWGAGEAAHLIGELLLGMLQILSPLMLAVAVAVVALSMAQHGPVFSAEPLSPDFERINPAAGIKRLFSMRILFEAGKSVFKLVVLAYIAYAVVRAAIPGLMGLAVIAPRNHARILLDVTAGLLVKLVLAIVVLALADYMFNRWDYAKRMRMSRRDIKDEHKNREGDPRIRQRMRELRMETLKRSQSITKVPSADVLITNPTHLAIALSYDPAAGTAPQVVAKGAGELAGRMRQLASRHHVPIVQNKRLARALYREVGLDGYVPETMYGQLARIMVWVHMMRQARTQGSVHQR